ncbi:family 78 glycoside hydrolase catalytic domain [Saccharibacillus sp. CPCC 101409]|uniref:family 78 glycoside hydrolase catalytic domain n=1 Tax=Saccharibacillus sp. CPCC 101409 TaxID=3058041 RepID=UPI002671CC87|nr:family 78 glycoside hydrolase catalytic domain [Saccharibacillus sp. CPCC 101409]MDO3411782.1 family 78 glycoside hydrolase catalytic domain [Saccharibacillus sp. CPCC 101409]
MGKTTRLRCEYAVNPIGVQTDRPRFSWEPDSEEIDRRQAAYRIVVSGDENEALAGIGRLWDSGRVESEETFHIEYEGEPLLGQRRYYWAVGCWDRDGRFYEPEAAAYFETAILDPREWTASWIGAAASASAPLLRTTFHIAKKVERASLCISGLGYFELYLNGRRIGDEVLVPNWTDYGRRRIEGLLYPFDDRTGKRVHYLVHAVADDLVQGENAIGVMLGNGFYNQTERTVEGRMSYGAPRLIAQLDLVYADGTRERITSDPSWTCSAGPIVFNNVFYGEIYDARLEQNGWTEAGFDDSRWEQARLVRPPDGKLIAQISPPDKKIGTTAPVSRTEVRPGVYVFDFGLNFSGWVRIRMQGEAGRSVKIRFAENILPGGGLDFASCGGESQIQADTYILKGQGVEQYEPRFVWHGFRYAEVSGYPGVPEPADLVGVVVHAAVEPAGRFDCSDPLLNKVQSAFRRSQLSNLHGGVPSDCPHRERLGYTGDGHLSAEAAMYNFDMASFYSKWIEDIGDAQNRSTGFVPHTAPFNGGGGGVAWGCAYILMPWTMYAMYGDRRLLAGHYEGMKQWIAYLETRSGRGDRIEFEEEGSWFLGDWCVPEDNELPPELVATFYYGYTVQLLSRIAETLGRAEDARRFAELHRRICDSFNEWFFDRDRAVYSSGKQGADLFALALNAVPGEYEQRVWRRVLRYYKETRGGRLDTGIFGTFWLLELLGERGEIDLALQMIASTEFPGYGYMMANGATTLWESWDGHDSHNHPMFGTVSAWFYKYAAGLAPHPDTVAFGRGVFRPFRASSLNRASARIHTMRGRYEVHWSAEDGEAWECGIRVPPNCRADVYFPLERSGATVTSIDETERGWTIWPEEERENAENEAPELDRTEPGEKEAAIVLGSGRYTFRLKTEKGRSAGISFRKV